MNRAQFVFVARSLTLLSATSVSVLACSTPQAPSEGITTSTSSGNATQPNSETTNPNPTTSEPVVNKCEGLNGQTGCTFAEQCHPRSPDQDVCVCRHDGNGGTVWGCHPRFRFRMEGPLPPPNLAA